MEDPILEYRILETVHADEGRLTQRDISQKIGVSVSSVNFGLRLLAVKGFIKISGMNPRRLRYYLTPSGVLQKTILAYNFLKRQIALYEEARKNVLGKLAALKDDGVSVAAVYGWTPFTESAMLYLITEGIRITALYVEDPQGIEHVSRIPVKPISDFQDDCEVFVLMEPLPDVQQTVAGVKQVICFPAS